MVAHSNFFQRQASARRNTGLLVVLFLIAVTLITLAVCVVGYLFTRSQTSHLAFQDWLLSSHGLYTALAVVGVIFAGSVVRWMDLSGGGQRVANLVRARPIDPATQDLEERRLRNVVEEMAIASGISVPELYVMDHETGINAFVAGYSPGEAVMVVTHGTLTNLSRDELQGVVAHEFSHILNGDMRLNVRLIAILAGILMIGQIGTFLTQATFFSGHRHRYRGRSSGDGRARAAIAIVGVSLMVIGYIGVFFGRLIQSAVSRQREMLADASSVQFTRNPEGIGGALFKIGVKGGFLDTTTHASDMNHMCFSEAARMKLSSLLASHPPIDKRIEAIGPGLLARLRSRLRDTHSSEALKSATAGQSSYQTSNAVPEAAAGFAGATQSVSSRSASSADKNERFSASVGTVSKTSEDYAQALLRQLPATFRGLLYTRAGAVQFCYALLISGQPADVQHQHLSQIEAGSIFTPNPDLLDKLLKPLARLGDGVRLPALELAMPALRKLDPEERDQLIAACEALIKADKRVTLFEWTLLSFLRKHLAGDAQAVVPVRYKNYRSVKPHLLVLFSLLARTGNDHPDQQKALLKDTMAGFHSGRTPLEIPEKVSLKSLREALWHLNRLSPLLKPGILDAACHCVLADNEIQAREYEMIRLIADQLDCPMPPLQT